MNITWGCHTMLIQLLYPVMYRLQHSCSTDIHFSISLRVNLDWSCWERWFSACVWFFIKQYYLLSERLMKMPYLQYHSTSTRELMGTVAYISGATSAFYISQISITNAAVLYNFIICVFPSQALAPLHKSLNYASFNSLRWRNCVDFQ